MPEAGIDFRIDPRRCLVWRHRPGDIKHFSQMSHHRAPVIQQRPIVQPGPEKLPAVPLTVSAVTQPEQVRTDRIDGITTAKRCVHLPGSPQGQHHQRPPPTGPGHILPERQGKAKTRILEHSEVRGGKCTRKKIPGPRLKLANGLAGPAVVRQGVEVVPFASQRSQQGLVDGDQFLVLPEPPGVDFRLGLQQVLTHFRPQEIEHPRQHGGAAAVHARHQDQGLFSHFPALPYQRQARGRTGQL